MHDPWRERLVVGAVALFSLFVLLGGAGEIRAQKAQTAQTASPARQIEAPGFSVQVPASAQAMAQRDGLDLLIRDRAGFVVKVQTGNAVDKGGLANSFAKLEQAHLGEGRKWRSRRYRKQTTLAGLPALEAVYDGREVNTRVIAVRGRTSDFVLMYFAPPAVFDRHMPAFEAIAGSFRPAADQYPATARKAEASQAPQASQPPRPEAEPAQGNGLKPASRGDASHPVPRPTRQFANATLGYSIAYPQEWVAVRETPYMVVFSGAKGSEAYFATVSVQNVQPQDASTPREAAVSVHASLKRGLAAAGTQARIVADKAIVYDKDGQVLHGHQFLVIYRQNGREFAQWTVVLPRTAGTVTHVWSYAAPRRTFDLYRPLAAKMLKTLTITGSERTPTRSSTGKSVVK